MADHHALWPDKYVAITNGITPRRFMRFADPSLSILLDETLGRGWDVDLDQLAGLEDHIDDGDLVLVEDRRTARNGEIVVAIVDGEEATLKRYYPQGECVRLEPANAQYEPLVVASERVRIQGTVVGVLRLYD